METPGESWVPLFEVPPAIIPKAGSIGVHVDLPSDVMGISQGLAQPHHLNHLSPQPGTPMCGMGHYTWTLILLLPGVTTIIMRCDEFLP